MAELSIGEKAERVLKFALGARQPRVVRALSPYGFTEEELQEGWTLLSQLTDNKLDVVSSVIDQRLVGELDAWENHWFAIIEIVLRNNFPNVHAVVFRNLSQTEGAEVIISVSTLLDRLDAIVKPRDEGGLGDEGRAARARLERRGVTTDVVGVARDILAQIGSFEPMPEGEGEEPVETVEDAEKRLWSWYLEWSVIARAAIRDRRLLRSLGFLRVVKKAGGQLVEEIVTDEELVTEPDVVESTPR